jgi:transposase
MSGQTWRNPRLTEQGREAQPIQITQALQSLIHAAGTARAQGIPAIPEDVAALECLRDREDDVPRFVHDPRIPPTSNQAERDLGPVKTPQ